MPTYIAAIADYIAIYFVGATGYTAAYAYVYAAVVYTIEAAAIYGLNSAVKSLASSKGPSGAGRGLEIAITDSGQAGFAIYGRVRVSGVNIIPPITGGDNGEYLEQILAVAVHEIDSYQESFADDEQLGSITAVTGSSTDGKVTSGTYANKMYVRRYTGTMTQTVDYILNNRYPTVFTSTYRGRSVAYIALTYDWGDGKLYRGVPIMTFIVKGKKCYDPRKDSTNGGSGSHRYNNSSTWEWTSNPALCWADYLMADFGGSVLPANIDWPSVITAANVCDTGISIPGPSSESLFTFNGRITLADVPDWRNNAKLFIDAMMGRMVRRGDKWSCYAGGWNSPSWNVDKIDWISIDRIKTVAPRDRGRWNQVSCWYVDPNRNWQRVECYRRKNTTYQAADNNEPIPIEIEQPACISEYEAQRKAEFTLRQSRNQIAVAGRLMPRFRRMVTGDTVAMTFEENGWQDKLFRVRTMNLNPDASVDVTLTEEQAADWDTVTYNTVSVVAPPATNPTTPSEAVMTISNAVAGTLRFQLTEPIVRPFGTRYRIIRGVTGNDAPSGTVVYDGPSLQFDFPVGEHDAYYWSQAHVGSYDGPYYPNTFGVLAAPQVNLVTQVSCLTAQVFSGAGALHVSEVGRINFAPMLADGVFDIQATYRTELGNINGYSNLMLRFVTGVTSVYDGPHKMPIGGVPGARQPASIGGAFSYQAQNSAYVMLLWDVASGANSFTIDSVQIKVAILRG